MPALKCETIRDIANQDLCKETLLTDLTTYDENGERPKSDYNGKIWYVSTSQGGLPVYTKTTDMTVNSVTFPLSLFGPTGTDIFATLLLQRNPGPGADGAQVRQPIPCIIPQSI